MKTLRNRPARAATAGLLALALVALLTLGVASAPQSASAAQRVSVSAKLTTLDSEPVKILSDSRTVLRTAASVKTATPVKRASAVTKSWTSARTSTSTSSSSSSSSTSELSRAQSILAGYIARYPILKGSTVSFGDARGYQAICYYKSGRIVISSSHTASLERIIGHEIWHIIDWRDNGVIDWGENVPPN